MAFNINFNSKLNELLNELKLIKLDQLHPANLLQKATDLYATVDKYSGKWILQFSTIFLFISNLETNRKIPIICH